MSWEIIASTHLTHSVYEVLELSNGPTPDDQTGADQTAKDAFGRASESEVSNENKRAALVAIGAYTSTMVALGGLFFGLSLTVLWPAYKSKDGYVLAVGIFVLGFSLFSGMRVLGKQVTILRRGELHDESKRKNLTRWSLSQLTFLLAAVVLLGLFARWNLDFKSIPDSNVPTSPPPSASPDVSLSPPSAPPNSPPISSVNPSD